MHIDEVEDPEIKKIIQTRQEKGVQPSPTIVRTKNFLLEEIKSARKNRNLIEKFCIEARIRFNKDPKKNLKPMVDINLVIGGKFKDGKNELNESEEGIGFFKLQRQQMNSILKFLDFSTNYTKFQTGVQKKFLEKKFTKEESRRYMKIYEEWKMNEGESKSKSEQKKAEKLREQMYEIEKNYAYETIAAVRQIAINKYNLEYRKNQERSNMHIKIKQFEQSKQGGYFSGLWGGKSEDQKAQDDKDIQEFKDKLNKEFDDKFSGEEQKMESKMEDLLQNEPIFDENALKDMPNEWIQFIANIIIPKLRLVLLDEDSMIEKEKSIMEIQSSGMRTKAKLGQDWQEVDLSFGKLNIIDNISGSDIFQFLTETVFPGEKHSEGKDAVIIHFEQNPRYEDGEIKLRMQTRAHQFIFANMILVKELQEFFGGSQEPEDKIDLSYYTDRAKIKALEYMNQGADYLNEVQQTEYVHKGIEVDIEIFAPVLVIPESICDLTNKKTLVFNLGYIRVTSDLRPYHKDVDYKAINRGEELYDQYDLKLNGFQLTMIEELVDYKNWEDARHKIDIINQISINLKANRSMEPNHPTFPGLELFCKIHDIDIYFSDYIMANVLNIQNSLFPPPEPKEDQEKELTEEEKSQALEGEKDKRKVDNKISKKLNRHKRGRQFEESEDDEAEIEEVNEGEEDIEAEESSEAGEVKSIDAKSKSDVENNPENKKENEDHNVSTKVDQRILILFDKMNITIGEVITKEQADSRKYDGIVDVNRSEIPHINILEMRLEGLEIEVNSGKALNLNLIMTRLYIKDLQKVQDIKNEMQIGTKYLIPACYQMVLSNPDIEKDFDDTASQFTLRTKSVATEDFRSAFGDEDEDSAVAIEGARNSVTQLRMAVKMINQSTDVEFYFSNLRLIFTLPIIERLAKFQEKIGKLQKQNDDAKAKAKLEEVHKILKRADEDSDSEGSDIEQTREEILEKTKDILLKNAVEGQKEDSKDKGKGYYERFKEERNKHLMKGKKLKIKIVEQSPKMSAKGRLKNFEVWVPLDSLNEFSRVLALAFSMQLNFKDAKMIKHKVNDITSEIMESKLIKELMDANLMVNQFSLMMLNRHLMEVQGNLTNECIILPSRIGVIFDKFVNSNKNSDVTNVEVNIEPFDMKVGFREIDNFRKLGAVMSEFSQRLSQPSSDKVEEIEENEGENGQGQEVQVIDRSTQEYQQTKEVEELGYEEKQIIKQLEEGQKQKPKVSIKNRKHKQFIKLNARLISESINFSLMDDTGKHEYPLINFNISKIIASVNTETGEDDAVNFILKKMGISEHPYLKVDAGLLMESNYFNMDSGSYEPLLEPWTFSAQVMQKTGNSAMEVNLSSDEMLNINLTYGMALAVKRITKKINQQMEEWEDENKNEETKRKTMHQSLDKRKASKKKTPDSLKRRSIRDGEEDEEVSGFYFQNYLGVALRITLENHDVWKDQGVELNDEDEEASVLTFDEWEDKDERQFRNLKELNNINKYVKKQLNGGKLVENFEDNITRFDIFIEGFEPITGVPVEISGRRSYELIYAGETEKQAKKHEHQFSITVNVRPEGKKKIVSFESQLTINNKTEFDVEIAQILTEGLEEEPNQISKEEIEKCHANVKAAYVKENEQKVNKYEDLVLFENVYANTEYKVPLRWFFDQVAIYYKCERGTNVHYRRLMPNLKKLLLKKDANKKPYEDLPKYHLLKQEGIDNTFIALDIVRQKCRPTSLDRPPHFECNLAPPICLNNMTFSEISVYRNTDETLINSIKSGGYIYLYAGVQKERKDPGSDDEDEKMREKEQMAKDKNKQKEVYEGDIHFNKYYFKFVDDGNIIYESEPDYFYSMKTEYKFYSERSDDNLAEEDQEEPIALTFDVIKFNTFIYTPYVLVNQTDIPIYFGEKGSKYDKARLIGPHMNEFFNPQSSKKKKFSVTVENYEWADPFDITTLGMSGEVSMKRSKDYDHENKIIQKYNSSNLNMGVIISTLSAPFGKTTAIKLVPRYVFMNHCKKPLVLSQDSENPLKQYFLKPGETVTYNFEHKGSKENFVKLREPTSRDNGKEEFEDYKAIEPTAWSSRFSIDDFEDFQISIKSSEVAHNEEIKELSLQHEDENAETLEQNNMDEVKWYEPSALNDFRRFVRVIITTKDQATLFIMLCDPNMPEYRVNNYSAKKVSVYQKDVGKRTIVRSCKKARLIKSKGKRNHIETYPIPFVWDDQTKDEKKIIIEIDGEKKEYDLDEIEEKKDFIIKKRKYFVKLISTGYFRELEIRDKQSNKEKLDNPSEMLKRLMIATSSKKNEFRANMNLRGVGVSIVDKEPKEILYISVYKIVMKAKTEVNDKGKGVIESNEEYDLIIYHMQVDNMVSLENPILFSPDEVLDKERILNDPEYTPFVQMKVSYSNNKSANVSRKKIDAFQVMIQEMKVEVETGTLNIIINTVTEITGVFGDQGTEYLSAQTVKQKRDKEKLKDADYKKKPKAIMEKEDAKASVADKKSRHSKVDVDKEVKEEGKEFRKEEVCQELVTTSPDPPELSAINTDKLYFNMIHLGAIKIKVTFRFEKKALDFDMSQGFGALTIVYTLATSVANVSDAPLSFKELVITNIFQSQAALIDSLVKNYMRQGMFQFYKLIGSSDLLGNPVGFVDKLGSGVFEFFNEPRKGLIKGPKEFVGGVGKGVTSLVTGVVSASFDSVSKISGSLYSVAKNVTGQEALPHKRSENAVEGVYNGVVGGGKELIGGVTGVFTKPFEGAQQEGAKGFFKGVGKGVLGLVASPITAVLKAGHSVSQGVTNTAIRIKRGKLPSYGRFRHPRYINTRNILEPYNEDFAEVNQMLIKVADGKYSKHNIRYFADFPIYKDSKKSKDEGTLIVTEQTLLFCRDEKKLLFHTSLPDLTDISVYEGGKDRETEQKLYHLYVYSRKNRNYVFETVQYALIDKTYSILSKEKKAKNNIPTKPKKAIKE